MHDPLAIYTSMATELISLRRMHVRYEVIDQVVRTMPDANHAPNCWVCVDIDAPAFINFWLDRIHKRAATYDRASGRTSP